MKRIVFFLTIVLAFSAANSLFAQKSKRDTTITITKITEYGEVRLGYHSEQDNENYQFISLGVYANTRIKFMSDLFISSLVDINFGFADAKDNYNINFTPIVRYILGGRDGFRMVYGMGAGYSGFVLPGGDKLCSGMNSIIETGFGYSNYAVSLTARYFSHKKNSFATIGIYVSYSIY